MTDNTWGWSCCPVCGAVIADINEHVIWHEVAVQEILTDLVNDAVRDALKTLKEQPATTSPPATGGTTNRLIPTITAPAAGGTQP